MTTRHCSFTQGKKTMTEKSKEQIERERREKNLALEAKRSGKGFSYIDDDGCEVTITSGGHVFYNAGDWY